PGRCRSPESERVTRNAGSRCVRGRRTQRKEIAQKVTGSGAFADPAEKRNLLYVNGFGETCQSGIDPALQGGTIRSAASGNSGESAAEKAGGRGQPLRLVFFLYVPDVLIQGCACACTV